ncbi:MAG: ribonuclease H-like domain-containing protein [Promethearchaeota archaeon]
MLEDVRLSRPILTNEVGIREIHEREGTCLCIRKVFKLNPRLDLRKVFRLSKKWLERQLTLVKGIGPHYMNRGNLARAKRIKDVIYLAGMSLRRQASLLSTWIDEYNLDRLKGVKHLRGVGLLYGMDPGDVIYLDIETTGFRGSRVFLVALGTIDSGTNSLISIQYLARSIREEIVVIKKAMELIQSKRCVITYNGKSFDIPFLDDRVFYYFNENISDGIDLHVDLIHESRYFFNYSRIAKLSLIEREILHNSRGTDVPSSMIPAIYKRFLGSRLEPATVTRRLGEFFSVFSPGGVDVEVLGRDSIFNLYEVICHNITDITSLHSILLKIFKRILMNLRGGGHGARY